MAYDPTADKKQYVLTDMLDNIEGGASNTMKFLNEKMADDPDRWDDDVWRFMGQRIGGALIGGGVGSFGGPKGALGGAIVGGVMGFDNSAKLLGNIPGMRQLGRFQDATADGARYINEKLTPWLDPRVAGWGSRVVTDYLLERGVRSGVGKVKRAAVATKVKHGLVPDVVSDTAKKYGLDTKSTILAKMMDDIDGIDNTIRKGSKGEVVQNPFLKIYKREDAAWISQGLQSAVPAKPTAATKWDKKMDDIYNLFTGQDPDLPTAGAKELQKIKLHTPKGSTDPKFIKHHPAPLAHIARSLDYLTDDGVREGADYLSRRIGTPLGDFQPGTLAEEMFHSKMHRFLDDKLGSSKKGLLYKLEKKYFGDRTLKDGIGLQERINSGFYNELADVLVEQKGLIDDWYRALANRAEFKKVSLEEYVNEAAETIKLNKVLREIASGKRTKGLGASDLIDRVIGLENKELRDTMKDLLQYKEIDDILLSDEARNLKNLNLYKAKEQFLLELMNMDWAGGKLDAGKQVLKLIDEYDLPFTKTDQNMIDDLVDALERIPIEESLDPKVAKEIKEWLGRD